jgi:hypothetical protein
MGLRSRQRRIAGLSHEQTFDPETSKHIVQSLDGKSWLLPKTAEVMMYHHLTFFFLILLLLKNI